MFKHHFNIVALLIVSTSTIWAAEAEYKQKAEAGVIVSQEEIDKQSTPNGNLVAAVNVKKTTWEDYTLPPVNIESAKKALEAGANPNASFVVYAGFNTPVLWEATRRRSEKGVTLLLSHKANVNARDSVGQTALMIATGLTELNLVKLLIKNNAEIHAIDNYGKSALSHVSKKEIASLLLTHGAKIDHQDYDGRTLLLSSTEDGRYELAQYLLQYKASPYIKNKYGEDIFSVIEKHNATRNLEDKKSLENIRKLLETLPPSYEEAVATEPPVYELT